MDSGSKDTRTLILCSEFLPGPGGIANHAYSLAKWLTISGKIVEVWAPSRAEFKNSESLFDNSQPFEVRRFVKTKWRLIFYIGLILDLKKTIQRRDYSGIITSGMIPIIVGAILKHFYASDYKLTTVVHGIDINPSNPILRSLINWSLKKYDVIIPVSRFTASHLPEFARAKSEIINNGIDDIKLNELKLKNGNNNHSKLPGEPSLVTVGTVSLRKGQLNVLRALPEIIRHFPNVHYHIVGMLNEILPVKQLASELGINDHITIHGPVNDQELIRLLAGADLFIMLSTKTKSGDFEGFGIAILEANLMGVPAIGAIGTGIEDAILNNETGILVDAENPAQISTAIGTIIGNRDFYSQNAIRLAARHSWKEIIKRYTKVLNK